MDIRQIDYFLEVAEQQSFSNAAKSLHISQPALSRYILDLEKHFGVKLFKRMPKQITLTYAGERYFYHAKTISERIKELDREMNEVAALLKGRINVGMIRSGRQLSLSENIKIFKKMHPDITLHISEQLSKDLELGVLNGLYDIAFISEPLKPHGLKFKLLDENYTLLMIPKGHPKIIHAEKRELLPYPWIDIQAFEHDEFVLQDENCRMRHNLDVFFAVEKFKPKIEMLTQSTIDAIHFAESGIGLAFLTDGYVHYIAHPAKVELFCIGTPVSTSKFGVISRAGESLTCAMKDFIRLYMKQS